MVKLFFLWLLCIKYFTPEFCETKRNCGCHNEINPVTLQILERFVCEYSINATPICPLLIEQTAFKGEIVQPTFKDFISQTLHAGHRGYKPTLGSCAFLCWLVWIGVGAKNLNEDKLVPAGAIRQKMNPLYTRGFLPYFPLLPPSLSHRPSIGTFSLFSTHFTP